jgi:hypothetical protein
MDEDRFEDLKQLITTTVNLAVKQGIAEAEQRISNNINEMRQEMREGFAGVGDAFTPANDQLADHEGRITKLEQQAA